MQALSGCRRLVLLSFLVAGVAWLARASAGDEPEKGKARPEAVAKPKLPPYPRVNLATVYVADPSWPRKPDGLRWGAMPGLAIDGKDRVYVYTRAVPPVQVYDADGTFLKSWGEDLVKDPHHIRVDRRGNVWLADTGHHVVMQCTPDGKLLKMLGTKGEPGEDEAHFNLPTDMAVTPEGEVFVSDGYGNSRIVHFDRDGKFVKAWGKLGIRPGEFSNPHAIALDSKGRLYVADRSNGRVQVFDQGGRFLDEWRNLVIPWGLWITPDDEVWVCGSTPMPWRETDVILGNPPHDQVFMRFDTRASCSRSGGSRWETRGTNGPATATGSTRWRSTRRGTSTRATSRASGRRSSSSRTDPRPCPSASPREVERRPALGARRGPQSQYWPPQ